MVGVRAIEDEHVRKARHGGAQVRLGPLVPDPVQLTPVEPEDRQRGDEVLGLEAGPVDDHVGGPFDAVGADDAGGLDPLDRPADQLDVGADEGRVPVRGEEDPLAADLVVGRRLGDQLRVAERAPALALGDPTERRHQPPVPGEPVGRGLEEGEHTEPRRGDTGREALEQLALPGRVGAVELRQHPGGRALVDRQALGDVGDRGHELDRAGAGADHRHPLAGELDVVIPFGGVKDRALEVLDPGDRRDLGTAELAAGGDQEVELVALAVGRDHRPAPRLRVEARLRDLDPEPQMRAQAELGDAVLEVGEDLGLRRVAARPAVAGRERERVQVRGHVAGRAGVGVGAPDAAHGVAALEDRQLLDSGLLEPDRDPDPAETRPDDADRERARVSIAARHARGSIYRCGACEGVGWRRAPGEPRRSRRGVQAGTTAGPGLACARVARHADARRRAVRVHAPRRRAAGLPQAPVRAHARAAAGPAAVEPAAGRGTAGRPRGCR